MRRTGIPMLLLVVAAACGAPLSQVPVDAGRPDAGEPDAGEPDAGAPDGGGLVQAFTHGRLMGEVMPRVSGAGLRLKHRGDTRYLLELTRDARGVERRRLVASGPDGERWVRAEAPGEQLTSFALHPSGELTVGIERRDAARDAFDLVRLDALGRELHRQQLAAPRTIPPQDFAAGLPAEPFLMKGVLDTSVVTGWLPWLALEARGEDVVVALVTYTAVPGAGPSDADVLSAVLALKWSGSAFTEEWARMVDGRHSLIAVAWQYDEFLWLDAATRLLLSVDPDGSVVVGRTLGSSRCSAVVATFGELSTQRCRQLRADTTPHRYQPFAFTAFSAQGQRLGTQTFAPSGFEDFVVFDMAVRGDRVAVVGTAVQLDPDTGSPDYYFEPPGHSSGTPLSPYDGYLAVLDRQTGAPLHTATVDLGRAEHLSAVTWTSEGLVAAGGAGWNRWWGGMSISRGAEPLLVLDRLDGSAPLSRHLATALGDRHAHALCLDTDGERVWAAGPFDAPMTHSGDADIAPMAFGGFTLTLSAR